jgi:hypothetical protein
MALTNLTNIGAITSAQTPIALAVAVATKSARAGQIITITDRDNGVFEYKENETTNGRNRVACTGVPSLSLVLRVNDKSTAKEFGAGAAGVSDDSLPIQGLVDALFELGYRGDINLGNGSFRITQPIVITGTGMVLKGNAAEFVTVMIADFVGTDIDDSPVIIVKGRYSGVQQLTIASSATRLAADYNEFAAGIAIHPNDTESNNCWFGTYQNLIISGQQGDGILAIGATWLSDFSKLTIRNNKGQGMRFDNGELTGRTNKENPGEVDITNVMIYDNDGHGILIGNDDSVSNRGFRFSINNADLYRNADAEGSRKSADQLWAFMDTSRIECSAFDGKSKAGALATTRGMKIAGRNVTVENNRFLEVGPQAIFLSDLGPTLGYSSYGFDIGQMNLFNTTPLNELVSYDPTVRIVKISPQTDASLSGIVPTGFSIPLTKRVEISEKSATQTINNSTTLVDVADLSTFLQGRESVQFRCYILYRGDPTADIKIGVTVPAGASVSFSPAGSVYIGTGDAVSISSTKFSSAATIQFGTATGNDTRVLEVVGSIKTVGDNGDFNIQFAQNSANASDTQILSSSYLEVIRH